MMRSNPPRRRDTTPPQDYADTIPQQDRSPSHDFVLHAIYELKGQVSEIGQKVSDGVDRLDRKLDDLERRLDHKVEQVDKRVECIDGKLGQVEHKVTLVKGIAITVGAVCTLMAFIITTFLMMGARIEFGAKPEPAPVERASAE